MSALAGGRDSVVQHLQEQQDKMSSAAMAANGMLENGGDLLNAINAFKARLKKQGRGIPVTESAGQLAYTAAAQSQRMVAGDARQAQVVGQRIRAFIAMRHTSVITRHASVVRLDVLALQVQETVWGQPQAGSSSSMRTVRRSKFMQSVSGGFIGAYQADTRIAIDMWIPSEAEKMSKSGIYADADSPLHQRSSALSGKRPLALPVPEDNFWKGMMQHLKGQNGKVSKGLLGLGVALSIANLNQKLAALDAAYQPGSTEDKATAWQSVVSGSMAMASVIGELTAGTLAKRADKKFIAKTTRAGLLHAAGWAALGGGIAAFIASAIDGYQAWMQSVKMGEQGDEDAKTAYKVLAVTNFVMGVAFAGFAAIAAGKLFLAAGATTGIAGALAGMVSAFGWIPYVGWALLAIGFAAAIAAYFISKDAAEKTDTPLEVWLSRCHWRAPSPRPLYSQTEEMEALQKALYSMHVTFEWDDNSLIPFVSHDEITIRIVLPGYTDSHSEYAWALTLPNPENGRAPIVIDHHTSPYSNDPALKPRPPAQHYLQQWDGIKRKPIYAIKDRFTLSRQKGMAILSGTVSVDDSHFNQATLRLEYWPDAINQPSLKLTPLGNGTNLQTVRD